MKSIKIIAIALLALNLISCEAIQKATNTTGSAFSLTGQWELTSSAPDTEILGVGSKITVAPIVSEGRVTTLASTAACLRQNDVVWSSIKANNIGGFSISNVVNACNSISYQPAQIAVISNTEITLSGKNRDGKDLTQTWKRIK